MIAFFRSLALVGALAAGGAADAAGAAHDCELFAEAPRVPIVHLDAAAIDSIGRSMSDANVDLIERVDRAYREGAYGAPGESESRKNALAAFIYNARVAFDFVRSIAEQHEVIYSTSEGDLRDAFTKGFRNPGIYPVMNLLDARAGLGKFCLKFEVDDRKKREMEVSGEKMRAWTEELEIEDRRVPVVNIDMKTFSNDRVHIIYERFSCGTFGRYQADVRGFPVQVFTMENLEGQYVRKFGLHRAAAVVMWKSPPGADLAPPPRDARFLGSAIYFPRLKLNLPWFLPSLGFHDLRKFEFPEPVLTVEATEELRRRNYDWISVRKNDRLADWEGDGQVPAFVEERFPDL